MKSVLRWCVVPLLATTLVAQTAPRPKSRKAAVPPAQPAVTAQDVQSLRDALAAQQQQIEQLKQQLQQRDQAWQQTQQQLQQAQSAAADAQQKAASVQTASTEEKDSVAKLSSDMDDVKTTLTNTAVGTQEEQKRVSTLEGLLGRFRFNGDVRVRGESFFQDAPGFFDRNRGRIRARFGVEGKLSDDFVGGFYLASGTPADPTSTNTTLTNFFERHTVSIDRGFVTYNPLAHKWISLTGGKFAYTWIRSPQTFDNDLNPEGFSEKFSWDFTTPIVKNLTFTAMQLLLNEVSRGTDSYNIGGQVSGRFQIGPLTTTPSFSLMKWNNPDTILQASAFAVGTSPAEGPGCATGAGLPSAAPCAFGANGMTNATLTDASGKPHFWSQFFYADFILNNQIKTGIARLPLNLLLEYENNLSAKDHPLDPAGLELTNLGKQSHAYLAEISLGQSRNKNDFQVGYAWARQEQDSAIASFVESDQRAPTNILQHRIFGSWKLRNNVTAAYTLWIGRTLNINLQHAVVASGTTPGTTEPNLRRMQFDLVYAF